MMNKNVRMKKMTTFKNFKMDTKHQEVMQKIIITMAMKVATKKLKKVVMRSHQVNLIVKVSRSKNMKNKKNNKVGLILMKQNLKMQKYQKINIHKLNQ